MEKILILLLFVILGIFVCTKDPAGLGDRLQTVLLTDTTLIAGDTLQISSDAATKILQGNNKSYEWKCSTSTCLIGNKTSSTIRFSTAVPGRYSVDLTVFEDAYKVILGKAIILVLPKPNRIIAEIRFSDTVNNGNIRTTSVWFSRHDTLRVIQFKNDSITDTVVVQSAYDYIGDKSFFTFDSIYLHGKGIGCDTNCHWSFNWLCSDTNLVFKFKDAASTSIWAIQPGIYKIRLKISNDSTHQSDSTILLLKISSIVARFYLSPDIAVLKKGDTLPIRAIFADSSNLVSESLSIVWSIEGSGRIWPNYGVNVLFTSDSPEVSKIRARIFSKNVAIDSAFALIAVREAPIFSVHAIARYDSVILNGDTATLDAQRSRDSSKRALNYLWESFSGGLIAHPNAEKTSFIPREPGNYMFSLRVADSLDTAVTDRTMFSIRVLSNKPTANAGKDTAIKKDSSVNLNGTQSLGRPLHWFWHSSFGGILSDSTDSIAHFRASKAETYPISLVVFNGKFYSDTDWVFVSVLDTSIKLRAFAGPEKITLKNVGVRLDGSMSQDSNKVPIRYHWKSENGGSFDKADTCRPLFTGDSVKTYLISLFVFNGNDTSAQTFTLVTVKEDTVKPPFAKIIPIDTIEINKTVTIDGSQSTSSNGGHLIYHWKSLDGGTLSIASDSARPTFSSSVRGNYTVMLTVTEGNTASTPVWITFTVIDKRQPPIAKAGNNDTININTPILLDGTQSSSANGPIQTYTWLSLNGGSLVNGNSAKPTFTSSTLGQYVIKLTVNDGFQESSADYLTITVRDTNKAPIADAGKNDTVSLGDSIQLNGSGSADPNNDRLFYTWSAPLGGKLSNDTAIKPWFSAQAAGNYLIRLRVFDGKDSSDNIGLVRITVLDTTYIPRFRPTAIIAGRDTTYFIFDLKDSLQLDGSKSQFDPHATPHYIWKNAGNNPEMLRLDSIVNPHFKIIKPGVYTFFLYIFDGYFYSEPAQRTVTVFQPKIYVSERDYWAKYHKITDGINAASSGDTVFIGYGHYWENLIVSKYNVTIMGLGRDSVIVDGDGKSSTISLINSSFITLQNMRIIKGAEHPDCGGILDSASVYVNLNNIVVDSNYTEGLRLMGTCIMNINNTIFSNNRYNAIRTWNSKIDINNSLFVNNGLKDGFVNESNDTLRLSTIFSDYQPSTITITNSKFIDAKVKLLSVYCSTDVTFKSNLIQNVDKGIYFAPMSKGILMMQNNAFRDFNGYCLFFDGTTLARLGSQYDTLESTATPLWCNGAVSLNVQNDIISNRSAIKFHSEKGMDIGGCQEGTLAGNRIKGFSKGIIIRDSPLEIRNNIFDFDSIGVCVLDTILLPNIHNDNFFPGCTIDTTSNCDW